jgi:hypothetical protein
MATAVEPKKSTPSLWDLLERRYEDQQGWLLFYEVAQRTGYNNTGYADAMAFSVWPSRGIQLLGFEVKRSRSDLLKELRDEQKAEKFIKFCHQWWLVVSDAKLTEGVEVPPNWGILAPRNQVLYQVRPAAKLEPAQWTPDFIASLMRRFHEAHAKKDMAEMRAAVEERAKALSQVSVQKVGQSDLAAAKREAERYKDQAELLERRIKDFETKSGIPVNTWQASNIGELVKAMGAVAGRVHMKNQLQAIKDAADRISKSMAGAMKNVDQMADPKIK